MSQQKGEISTNNLIRSPFRKHGIIISVVLHICIFALLSIWTFSEQIIKPEGELISRWQNHTEDQQKILVITPAPIIEKQKNKTPDSSASKLFENNQIAITPILKTDATEPIMLPDSYSKDFNIQLTQPAVSSTGTGIPGTGPLNEGEGSGIPFFGINAIGKKVVYVVDCSRSMNHSHSGRFRTRFDRIQFELHQSINHLENESEFFIIFFNHEAIPMPASQLQLATAKTREQYLHWAKKIKADGNTDPRQALRLALSLKPEVIYFLTDGSIETLKIKRGLKRIKQKVSSIHTIAFGNRDAEPLLRKISSQNNGRFFFEP